jgi:Methyltransferase domain
MLDIGAGPGDIARELATKGGHTAVVDQPPPSAPTPGVEMHVQDLDAETLTFDYHLLLDILEHLRDPERFLERLRGHLDHTPRSVVITTPNVAFAVQRLMLLARHFNYGKAGILDRTHTRLFTFRTLRHLLRDVGLRVKEVRGVPAPFPTVLGNGVLARSAVALNLALIRLNKTLFSYQIFVVAEPPRHRLRAEGHEGAERRTGRGRARHAVPPHRPGLRCAGRRPCRERQVASNPARYRRTWQWPMCTPRPSQAAASGPDAQVRRCLRSDAHACRSKSGEGPGGFRSRASIPCARKAESTRRSVSSLQPRYRAMNGALQPSAASSTISTRSRTHTTNPHPASGPDFSAECAMPRSPCGLMTRVDNYRCPEA